MNIEETRFIKIPSIQNAWRKGKEPPSLEQHANEFPLKASKMIVTTDESNFASHLLRFQFQLVRGM